MSLNYRIKGLDQFLKQVQQKPKQVEARVDRELQNSALRVEATAKELAPWDTGWLAENIYGHKVKPLTQWVISPVHYSIYNELGTRYMPATPFIYPAVQKEYPLLFRNLKTIVGAK